jgi:hypothetical protein
MGIHQDRASSIDSVRRNVLFNTAIQLARLTNWCLNDTCSRVQVGKHLKCCLLGMVCFRICHLEGSGKLGGLEIKWYTSASGLCWC